MRIWLIYHWFVLMYFMHWPHFGFISFIVVIFLIFWYLLTDLSEERREAEVHPVDLELGAPDVGAYLHHPPLLWQRVQVVHLLVADVAEVVRLVSSPPRPPVPPPQPRRVEGRGRGVLLVRQLRVRGRVCNITNSWIFCPRQNQKIT